MFGDVGHGAVLLTLGLILTMFPNVIRFYVPSIHALVDFRYSLVLMGFFSTYCGFIYNDFMSVPLNIFKSCYKDGKLIDTNCTYPFGIDIAWFMTEKELTYMNSLKMKIAVILGCL